MFERYTEKARRVIFFARYEASQFGATQIEPAHILLGLIREDKGLFSKRLLRDRQLDLEKIRKMIEGKAPSRITDSIDLQLSGETKRVLAYAAEESEKLSHWHIGTEHLLLGLLREENSSTGKILLELGLQLSEIRAAITSESQEESEQVFVWRGNQQAEDKEKWMGLVLKTCYEREVFTKADFVDEFKRVAALRQFSVSTEALLRLLAEKGLADPDRLPELALDFREETKLAEFIEKLKGI